jgi:hypothetical protein
MTMTLAAKGATPQIYVQQLRLTSSTSNAYLSILNGFQRFLAEQIEALAKLDTC